MLEELNLNLCATFFWLSLSAGLLLPGIWFLIDCKINLWIINFILQRFGHYGKLTNNGLISKSYFLYFYLFGLLINLIFLVFHLSFFLLFILFLLHLYRRLYECMYIQKFTSKLNFLQIFFGLIHYPCVGLTIIIDYQYSYTNIQFFKYLFALIIFFNASYIQHNVHLTLAKLIRYENVVYPIPNGYWIFNYLSCPNTIAEIFIYISFLIASHRTSAMFALIVWVFVNQSLSALLNHRWYCRYYKESYPSNRYALIPFILYNEFDNKMHMSDVQLQRLRRVLKTKIGGELTIKSSNLERTLYLAGQNLSKNTVEIIRKNLEDIYHTDEYFLDEIEFILAPYWEELTDDDIARLLIQSFRIFDSENQGFIFKDNLIEYLTKYGDMPLNKIDFQIMFTMIKNSKQFNYQQFVKKLCYSKPKKKKKVKRTIK